ncbi:MAG TPA: IS4 family transposase [Schlesneria sp.]
MSTLPTLVEDCYESASFGDQRLTDRLVKIVDQMSEYPNLSIPSVMKVRAGTDATYRFFKNKRVTPEAILEPHICATKERVGQLRVALLVQDTTEIDLTRPEQQVQGAGPLDGNKRLGALYHPLMAFSDQGLALGTVWNKTWIREEEGEAEKERREKLSAAEKREEMRHRPIEEKESIRWLEGFRAALATAKQCPQTQCICIGDSEADIYELFLEQCQVNQTRKLEMLVRSGRDRSQKGGGGKVLDALRDTPCLFTNSVDVSKRTLKIKVKKGPRNQPRDARLAQVEVRAKTVTLHPSSRPNGSLAEVTVNVVLVEETNTPEGQIPIQWLLMTTLPIDTLEQVQSIVQYYTVRWQIEIYFRTLKSGCRVEERYFEKIERTLNCLAVYCIVAWQILYMCHLSRECPDVSCEVVFDPSEWMPLYMAIYRATPPKTSPTLNEVVRMIASLGGYVSRKSTEPGTQTLWIGMQRLNDLVLAWHAFGPGATLR